MNKTQQAKALNVSRPTLNKMIKVHGETFIHLEAVREARKQNMYDFIRQYPHISVYDLENLLEHLDDKGFLSDDGSAFRNDLWETFIKKDK